MTASKLQLHFNLKRKETSKDSNSSSTSIIINNDLITYNKMFQGFRASDNESLSKKITPKAENEITNFIIEKELNVNLSETKETSGIGIATHLSFSIESPFNHKINISGKSNIWGTDEYVRKEWGRKYVKSRTNIENLKYIEAAESFIRLINKILQN